MSDLPLPLTPADCDLRDFQFMPLDVVRLRDSDLAALETPEACWAAVLLWCASWHQQPAASLPDDDRVLSQLAGFGRVVKEWLRIRSGALRGWIKCSDGRLYHPVVAEKAREAWVSKIQQRHKTECARIKKYNHRHGTQVPFPTLEEFMSPSYRAAVPGDIDGLSLGTTPPCPDDKTPMSPRTTRPCPQVVPGETQSKGQGQGQGQGQRKPYSDPDGSGGSPPEKTAEQMTKDELWSAGKSLLEQGGMPRAQCGTFVGKLVKDYTADVVIDAVRRAVVERPADPASFLKAVCQAVAGERKPHNRQDARERANLDIAAQVAAEIEGAAQ